jgi:hypothetical protein
MTSRGQGTANDVAAKTIRRSHQTLPCGIRPGQPAQGSQQAGGHDARDHAVLGARAQSRGHCFRRTFTSRASHRTAGSASASTPTSATVRPARRRVPGSSRNDLRNRQAGRRHRSRSAGHYGRAIRRAYCRDPCRRHIRQRAQHVVPDGRDQGSARTRPLNLNANAGSSLVSGLPC